MLINMNGKDYKLSTGVTVLHRYEMEFGEKLLEVIAPFIENNENTTVVNYDINGIYKILFCMFTEGGNDEYAGDYLGFLRFLGDEPPTVDYLTENVISKYIFSLFSKQ